MQHKLDIIRQTIDQGKFPSVYPHFAGANLIITNDKNIKGFESDKVIYTEHASAISWLIDELKEVYSTRLNANNKYDYYPAISKMIESSVEYNDDLFDTLNFIIDESQKYWNTDI